MKLNVKAVLLVALVVAMVPASVFALEAYSQDFASISPPAPGALLGDGWVVYANVFTSGGAYLYGYGTYAAPNDGAAFCAIAVGEGGGSQGMQQLSVYSDYNNAGAHNAGDLVEANVFREQMVTAGDVGETWVFEFDAKMGNLVAPTTAAGFIKTLNPAAGWATTNYITVDTTAIPTTWGTYSVQITIDPTLVGQIFQSGFTSTASNWAGSGVFYDNVSLTNNGDVVADDVMTWGAVKSIY